jgi:hypothetical protein
MQHINLQFQKKQFRVLSKTDKKYAAVISAENTHFGENLAHKNRPLEPILDFLMGNYIQRQRCVRLERYSKYKKKMYSKRTRLVVAL